MNSEQNKKTREKEIVSKFLDRYFDEGSRYILYEDESPDFVVKAGHTCVGIELTEGWLGDEKRMWSECHRAKTDLESALTAMGFRGTVFLQYQGNRLLCDDARRQRSYEARKIPELCSQPDKNIFSQAECAGLGLERIKRIKVVTEQDIKIADVHTQTDAKLDHLGTKGIGSSPGCVKVLPEISYIHQYNLREHLEKKANKLVIWRSAKPWIDEF